MVAVIFKILKNEYKERNYERKKKKRKNLQNGICKACSRKCNYINK